jgi:hypothetical protein
MGIVLLPPGVNPIAVNKYIICNFRCRLIGYLPDDGLMKKEMRRRSINKRGITNCCLYFEGSFSVYCSVGGRRVLMDYYDKQRLIYISSIN